MSTNALSPPTEKSALQDAIRHGNHSPHFQESPGKAHPVPRALLVVLRRDRYLPVGALGISRLPLCFCAAEEVKHKAIKSCKQPLPLETGIY